jgi:hypothetical protein
MRFDKPAVSLESITRDVVRLMPEYLPGVATGTAANTEGRSCWLKTWKNLLTALGRQHGFEVVLKEEGLSALEKQLSLFWKRGDAILVAFISGWGDRQDMEQRFQLLETLKAHQKVILYSCLRWQEAVIEQFEATLLRYPYHIEGEEYLFLNVMAPDHRIGAHTLTISRSGTLTMNDVRLQLAKGSPFPWRQPQVTGVASDSAV